MRAFLCRWPNGDCSVVLARSKADAVEKLDEVANAEGCPMVELSEAQVHFALTDDGQLVLEGSGEDTEQDIFEFCYPVLGEALVAGKDVVRAVQLERDRGKAARMIGRSRRRPRRSWAAGRRRNSTCRPVSLTGWCPRRQNGDSARSSRAGTRVDGVDNGSDCRAEVAKGRGVPARPASTRH